MPRKSGKRQKSKKKLLRKKSESQLLLKNAKTRHLKIIPISG
jgi:hypothetical protein